MGDMHVLALLQQVQVQRAAQDALESLDKQSLQAEAASEQLHALAIKVWMFCHTASAAIHYDML